tara:strand:- start:1812 stop:2003 length:192 start_codon:yes stop_codon:yes gene_type:complete
MIIDELKTALDLLDDEEYFKAYDTLNKVIRDLERSLARYNSHLTGAFDDSNIRVDEKQFEDLE